VGLYDDETPINRRTRYEKMRASLVSQRRGGGWDAHWRDIADFIYPRRYRSQTSDTNKGTKTNQNIIDSTAKFAAKTLQSGLHAGITSPARPWFKLGTPDPDLAEFGPVKEWLHIVTQRMYAVMAGSNVYNGLHSLYLDYGLFGVSPMALFDDDQDLCRSYVYAAGTYAVALDARGRVSTFVREYRLTVRQLVEIFAQTGSRGIDRSKLPREVLTAWDRSDYEQTFDVCHLIKPNDHADRTRPWSVNLPWSSCYWIIGIERPDVQFLRESGFHEFPIFCPRWEITGEDSYSTDSPGMTVLGDVKQLQTMMRRKGQLVEKAVDPPMKGPSSLRTQKVSLLAGDITYTDGLDSNKSLVPIHEPRLEGYQHLTQDAEETRYLIRRGFFEDLFLMLAQSQRMGQPITAREVEERHEEKLIALGPVLERTNDELLNPLIDRLFGMMERAGLLPEAPPDIEDVKLRVEYVSILAQAQKLVGVSSLDRFTQTVLAMAPVVPSVLHKVNFNQVLENYQEALGTDPRTLYTDEEAEQREQDANAGQQQMAEAAAAKDMSSAVATAGAAPIAPDSPLDAIMSGMGGAM
jgi:hypothetical protein